MKRYIFISLLFIATLTLAGAVSTPADAANKPYYPLFSPGWRNNDVGAQHDKFSRVFGHHNPNRVRSTGAHAIKYSLGPYVTRDKVPCDIIPDSYGDRTGCGLNSLPEKVFAKDRHGNAIWVKPFPNIFLLNPKRSANYMADLAKRDMKYGDRNFYDDYLSDSVGISPVTGGYTSAQPINPETDKPYSIRQWMASMKVMIAAKREGAGKKIIINGMSNATAYEHSKTLLTDDVKGAMAEGMFRKAPDPITSHRTYDEWLADVRMVEDIRSKNVDGYFWTKCWVGAQLKCDESAELNKIVRFSYGSFLLGAGERSYFNFDRNQNENTTEWYSVYDAVSKLGRPDGQRTRDGRIHSRRFEHGKVIVNPTAQEVTIRLENKHKDALRGGDAFKKITIKPYDTAYLLRT